MHDIKAIRDNPEAFDLHWSGKGRSGAAAEAVKLIKPTTVIPMHFGTFPVLTGTVDAFEKALKKTGTKTALKELKIGETVSF